MRMRLVYLWALPVMATAPLHFAASRYQPTKCGAEQSPVLATQGDKQYEVTRVIDVPQPNPLGLWHWLAGAGSLLIPPIGVAVDALGGVRGETDDDDLPDPDRATPVAATGPDPNDADLLNDDPRTDQGDDGAMAFPDPLADDFDLRLAAAPPVINPTPVTPVEAPQPNTEDWMAAIIAATQSRPPQPPIAPAEFADPLNLDTELDDQPALV